MAALEVSDLAYRLRTDSKFIGMTWDTVYRNVRSLIGRIIPVKPYMAGKELKVNLDIGTNSSVEVFVENQSEPERGHQTQIQATSPFVNFRALIGQTGHARRAQGVGGMGLLDGDLEHELRLAVADIRDLMTTTFLSSNAYYLLGLIDDTLNYMDLSRTSYPTLKCYTLNGSSAALSTALINKAMWRSTVPPFASEIELWAAPPLQCGALAELQSAKMAIQNPNTDMIPGVSLYAGGAPVLSTPDLTNSVMLGFSNLTNAWGYVPNEPGNLGGDYSGFFVKELGAMDDSDTLQISTAGAIYCTEPHRQVKIYGLSTT